MQTLSSGATLQGGKYIIKQVLGQGGFGITYLAEHSLLGADVAIKEFFMKELCERDEETSHVSVGSSGSREMVEKFREKFLKEARNIYRLNHPHIVRIQDIFEENGTAYYVMEYCKGGSLSELLKQHPNGLPEVEALKYIREVASALEHIHQQKMNHLDIKPGNIMLNDADNAVLIDFGLSKQYDVQTGQQTSTTPVGISHGYAPMEQYRQGGVSEFSPATDIYSLGATLYKLITGQTPPSALDLGEEDLPDFPASASVKAAILAAMKHFRKDRPQTVAAWLELLNNNIHAHVEEETEVTIIGMEETKKPDSPKKPETSKKQETPKIPVAKPVPAPKSSSKMPLILAALVAVVGIVLGVWLFGEGDSKTATIEEPKAVATTGTANGHEWVDLGLPSGTKWATMNVGATSPSDYGSYFAWGETSPKSSYDWSTYRWCNGSYDSQTKYCTSSSYGTVDNKTVLDLNDDAARVNWGGDWRMPSKAQQDELREKCKWTWSSQGGHNGYKVVGPNGNSIFLPAAGYRNGSSLYNDGTVGYYWSSSLGTGFSYCAGYLSFISGGKDTGSYDRCFGLSVRPVRQ